MHKLFFIIISVLAFQEIYAQKEVTWLKNNIALINLDTTQKDDSQYEAIKKSIGNARVVLLGEQTHGDGTTFETKVQLIKYLHDKMGFTVLAFESPLFNAERAWLDVQANINPLYALQNATGAIWGNTKELQPLFQYIISKRKSETPLIVSGFDCQMFGQFNNKYFITNLIMFLNTNKISFKDIDEKDKFLKVYYALINGSLYKKLENKVGDSRKQYLDSFFLDKQFFLNVLNKKISQLSTIDEKQGSLYLQQLKSLKNYLPELLRSNGVDSSYSDVSGISQNLRDSLMAENIIWLANKQYSDRKIIIWAASYHNARHKSVGYGNMKETLMGDYLKPALEKISYSIAFTTYEGFFGRWNSKDSTALEKPSINSFEDLFSKLGTDNFFLDFKTLSKTKNGNWLTKPKIMRPLGYREQEKNWTLVFDAVIFNRKMTKAHSIF